MTDPLMTYAYAGRCEPVSSGAGDRRDRQFRSRSAGGDRSGPRRTSAADLPRRRHVAFRPVEHRRRACVLGDGFKKIEVHDNGERITLGPAMIVAQANRMLKPSTASSARTRRARRPARSAASSTTILAACAAASPTTPITRCMRMRFMLADGTVLDTGDPSLGRAVFRQSKRSCSRRCTRWHHEVAADPELRRAASAEIPDQEHRRLFDQRADRFPRPDRHPDPSDHRQRGHARLRFRGDL